LLNAIVAAEGGAVVKTIGYQLIGDQIADTRIKLGRALEVGEKERETDDLEALVDGKRVGAVKIAKSLVGESRP
jgi:hypothetical protein